MYCFYSTVCCVLSELCLQCVRCLSVVKSAAVSVDYSSLLASLCDINGLSKGELVVSAKTNHDNNPDIN